MVQHDHARERDGSGDYRAGDRAAPEGTDKLGAAPTLGVGASPSLTIQQVQTVVDAEATAYSDTLAASLVTHPNVLSQVNSALTTLTNSVANIAVGTSTTPGTLLTSAIAAFDQAILDTTGLFGPLGTHNRRKR